MGMRYWQVLPVNPTDFFRSPYAGPSAFAGNIDLLPESHEELAADFAVWKTHGGEDADPLYTCLLYTAGGRCLADGRLLGRGLFLCRSGGGDRSLLGGFWLGLCLWGGLDLSGLRRRLGLYRCV